MPDVPPEWGWVAIVVVLAGYLARRIFENTRESQVDARSKTEDNTRKITAHKERITKLTETDQDIQSRVKRLEENVSEIKANSITREDLDRFENRIQTNIQNMKSSLDQRFDALINGLNMDQSENDEPS